MHHRRNRSGALFVAFALGLVQGLCLALALSFPVNGANGPTHFISARVESLDGPWLLATDAKNEGRDARWFLAPPPQGHAVPTQVPWIIQDAFPGYHGVAWFWRDFVAPHNPHVDGRYRLRFWAADYKADVWINGEAVGSHEGGETPFTLDVTSAIKPGASNRVAVRVVNPTDQPIDGLVLRETPARNKVNRYTGGNSYNHGGLVDSVELEVGPAVTVDDVFVQPHWKTGQVQVQVRIQNSSKKKMRGSVHFSVAPAAGGETLASFTLDRELPPGESAVETRFQIPHHRPWELNDPFLYRLTTRVAPRDSKSFAEGSVRFGFRDFRFRDGYFRLNGRRLFLRCSHTGNHSPVGLQLAPDPDFLRRDLLNVKVMGFNAIRFIAGVATRQQLDLCDEIGLLVYEESYAGWLLADSPKMKERFDRSTREMILRDRNHPSLVMWGLLNETVEGPVFRHAVGLLPLVRSLDDTRLVMLNSGRFDNQTAGTNSIGSLSNPGSREWEDVLGDMHPYQRTPHTAEIIQKLRTLEAGSKPVFLSEYGVGSAVDLIRVTRHYERWGKSQVEDARFYRDKLDRFLVDWERWHMADVFGRPEEFFAASLRKMAGERLLGLNAIRANPRMVAHSLSGTVDQGMSGEGLFTTWRELKPGTVDAVFDGWAPLRWCLFAEPVQAYRGERIRLEAVLANEDQLPPGEYPARFQIFGPNNEKIWERSASVRVAAPDSRSEPPFAIAALTADAVLDGPPGRYRFVAAFEQGAAPLGNEVFFHLDDRAQQPRLAHEVVLWGNDPVLTQWLAERKAVKRAYSPDAEKQTAPDIIVAGPLAPAPGGAPAFASLLRQVARGSTVIFLAPEIFAQDKQPVRWLPLAKKGTLTKQGGWLYHKDEWARRHPVFEGLPTGMMDYLFYREIIPDYFWSGQDAPAEAIVGANNASIEYSSGLMLSVHRFGLGRFVLNTLRIRENLSKDPVADRLLVNLIQFAGHELPKSVGALPADFSAQLKGFGFE